MFRAKRLVLVSTIFLLITEASKENEVILEQVPYIYYPFCFQKDTAGIRALIDSSSKVNAMTPA